MSQQELLKRVVEVLEAAGVEYVAVGSIVSSLQGEPRSTHDIDLVVAMGPGAVTPLVHAFPPPDFYLDEAAVREAVAAGQMFNLLDITGGDKVDFWVLGDDPYNKQCFARRYVEKVEGVSLYVQRPEDTILSKLRWAKMSGGSEKQFTDALRVYEVQYGKLDLRYIEDWADKLGIVPLLARLKSEASIAGDSIE